ncbi:MAG: hypothetical protein MRY74_08405 [Neomegalonema sp.]|nr:hypothetical protein [Neomegalonema sp.]
MTTQSTTRAKNRYINRYAAAFAVCAAGLAFAATPAAAETPTCLVDKDVTVIVDQFIPAFAVARPGPTGPVVVINPDRGVGLGVETQAWLLERQCYLVKKVGADAPTGTNGLLEFSPGEHKDADCEAYKRVSEANGGRATVVRVIDRDVSAQARGTYWDFGMGVEVRPIASSSCS